MMAVVGSDISFEHGREQLQLLAGLEVTAKAVGRQAEAIGADIERLEQNDIARAKQLGLPEIAAPAVPILYVEMDGSGMPVVKAELIGRSGKVEGQPARTREVKAGCVFTQTTTDSDGRPVRVPPPHPTLPPSRAPKRRPAFQRTRYRRFESPHGALGQPERPCHLTRRSAFARHSDGIFEALRERRLAPRHQYFFALQAVGHFTRYTSTSLLKTAPRQVTNLSRTECWFTR